MSRIRPITAALLGALCSAMLAHCPPAAARPADDEQSPTSAPVEGGTELLTDASEGHLWLAASDKERSRLMHRAIGGRFDPGHALSGKVERIVASGADAFVLCADGAFYRFLSDSLNLESERRIPGGQLPIELLGDGSAVYAIVPSGIAATLPIMGETTTAPAASAPIEVGKSPLALIVHNGREWLAVTDLPPSVRPPDSTQLVPQLGLRDGNLLLFWLSQPGQMAFAELDRSTRRWRSGGTLGLPGLRDFWLVTVNRQPTLVATTADAEDHEAVVAFRLMGEPSDPTPTWRRSSLTIGALPSAARFARVHDVIAFNQHVGLMVSDEQKNPFLVFARFGEPPAESSIELIKAFTAPDSREQLQSLQMLSLAVLVVVFTLLFAFRRGSMLQPAVVPPGWDLALSIQRLGGLLIDLTPFTVVAAAVLGVPWFDFLQRLAAWALQSEVDEQGLPPRELIAWWGLSAGAYIVYALIMELTAQRTVGKMLLGLRLLSESGASPSARQVVIRNLTRLIELLPPFFIMSFLLILTRNHQRLGDIFARTIVLRKIGQPQAEIVTKEPADGAASASTGDPSGSSGPTRDGVGSNIDETISDDPGQTPAARDRAQESAETNPADKPKDHPPGPA